MVGNTFDGPLYANVQPDLVRSGSGFSMKFGESTLQLHSNHQGKNGLKDCISCDGKYKTLFFPSLRVTHHDLWADRFQTPKQVCSAAKRSSISSTKMKAKIHRTKPSRIDYNNLDVICRIEEACEDIQNGRHKNVWQASKAYDIPYGTLLNRYNKCTKPSHQAHDDERIMNHEQEEVLVDWMKFLGMVGRPVSRATVRPKCIKLVGRLPGQTWIWRFLKRHPEIKVQKPSGLDPKCAWAFNYATVNDYFEKLTKVIKDNDIPWENIYNMDEKGIQLGGGCKGDG